MKKLSVLLIIVLVFSLPFATYAEVATTSDPLVITQDNMFEVIQDLEQYVHVTKDGILEFDFSSAVRAGYQKEDLQGLKEHIENLNKRALNNEIKINGNLKIDVIDELEYPNIMNTDTGINKFEEYWWGYRRYASNFESIRLAADYASVSTVGGAASLLSLTFKITAPFSIPVGLTAGYFNLVSNRISANNAQGRGVIIDMTWLCIFDIESQ